MISIYVRGVGRYREVQIGQDSTYIDSGLLDERECREYAEKLMEAANELLKGL